jgi:hypothetical protein
MNPTVLDLLVAETTLKAINDQMAAECTSNIDIWPREWMQKNAHDRTVMMKARKILLERAELNPPPPQAPE